MAIQGKRAWKLQENVAHGSQVTCLALGPASGRVMVTGGEDRKVNMWAIGKPNVIMSLSGHTSPVECVQFNSSENLVLAGSQSGTLKIWDLEAAKIVRTLTGHKASIKCLDFHPYGEFVASGSSDTNLKLWDVKRKGCIFTYKGHTNTVNHLRFSPDGRWIISAGEDGVAKLWDLTAGKMLNEFKQHKAAVNKIEFHPKEFLLATGSTDRTVKFWDLETFDMISSTDLEQSAVRTIAFHPEGKCLFSGSQDSLRIHGWEPSRCYETHSVGWGKVSDLSFSSNQLIGGSFSQTNVSVWVVDLAHLDQLISKVDEEEQTVKKALDDKVNKDFVGNAQDDKTNRKPSPQRKSFHTRPRTTSSKPRNIAKDEATAGNEEEAKIPENVEDPAKYDNVFKPSSTLRRSPLAERKNPEPFKAPAEEVKIEDARPVEPPKLPAEAPVPSTVAPGPTPTPLQPVHVGPKEVKAQAPITIQTPYAVHTTQPSEPKPFAPPTSIVNHSKEVHQPPLAPESEPRKTPVVMPVAAPTQLPKEKPNIGVKNEKRGFNVDDFMPAVKEKDVGVKSQQTRIDSVDDAAALLALNKSHSSICTIMTARLKNLSIVGQMWTDGEIKAAVQTAASMPDQAILVDLLNVLILKQTLWNLDICVALLPELKQMLNSKYESYVETGCNVIKLIIKNFAPVIKSNMAAPPASLGCDLVREERYIRCKKCHSYLLDIRDMASKLANSPGKHGALNKQIALALSVLD